MSDNLVRVAVDQELCIGGGICEMLEPEVFELDDDVVISSIIGDGLLPRARAEVAVDRCPGQAIAIVEENLDKEL